MFKFLQKLFLPNNQLIGRKIQGAEDYFWQFQLTELSGRLRSVVQQKYFETNMQTVKRSMAGLGPDNDDKDLDSRIKIVANIPSIHIPKFCEALQRGDRKPYKNCYDLNNAGKKRQAVDSSLPKTKSDYKNIYFCAVEMNGCGVRFYGDACFVLKPVASDNDLIILDRNSYDLVRSPLKELINGNKHKRKEIAAKMSGKFGQDLNDMVVVKVLQSKDKITRRLTQGQISGNICDDEDYIEVLWCRCDGSSFNVQDLSHVRTSASDTALENRISRNNSNDTIASFSEFLWARHRRLARKALALSRVSWKVVSHDGRVKS